MNIFGSWNLRSHLNGTAFAISMIVGTGIFGLTDIALQVGGPAGSLVGWIVASLAIIPFLCLFYLLEGSHSFEGGLTACVGRHLGQGLASGVRVILFVTYMAVVPIVVHVGSSYLQQSLHLPDRALSLLAVCILTTATILNWVGKSWMDRLNRWSWMVLVGILLTTVLWYLEYLQLGLHTLRRAFLGEEVPSPQAVWGTVSYVFFAFVGWENLVILRPFDPDEKKKWITYCLSYFFVTLLYFGLALVVSGASIVLSTQEGAIGLIELLKGLPFWPVFMGGAVLIVLSNVTSWMYGASQVFSQLITRGSTPWDAKASLFPLYAGFTCIFSLLTSEFVSVSNLVQIVNKNFLLIYLLILLVFLKVSKGLVERIVAFFSLISLVVFLDSIGLELIFSIFVFAVGCLTKRGSPPFGRDPHLTRKELS